jgi:hypothetical protein
LTPFHDDSDGDQGASIDVSGGRGFDANTSSTGNIFDLANPTHEYTRSDGGQGGFGLIQLQAGSTDGQPVVEQGVHLFAEVRATLKLGGWTGDDPALQADHPAFDSPQSAPPNDFRYIDMHHWRYFAYEPGEPDTSLRTHRAYILNGSTLPIIQPDPGGPAGPYQLDTEMIEHFGEMVVKEPQPEKIMKIYNGYTSGSFQEKNFDPDGPNGPLFPRPGILYDPSDELPFGIHMDEPSGLPIFADGPEGDAGRFEPSNIIDRLPVVPFGVAPVEFGTSSRATSRWLDFNGVALRTRADDGIPAPFFERFHGTYTGLFEAIPPGRESQVKANGQLAETSLAKKVDNTAPFDPGVFEDFSGIPPYNDIKVDAPEPQFSLEDAVTNNATVTVVFQGAYPVRAGSQVADPSSMTEWTPRLSELSGYPLLRFQVTFDVGADLDAFPFEAQSYRPAVDYMRVRASY